MFKVKSEDFRDAVELVNAFIKPKYRQGEYALVKISNNIMSVCYSAGYTHIIKKISITCNENKDEQAFMLPIEKMFGILMNMCSSPKTKMALLEIYVHNNTLKILGFQRVAIDGTDKIMREGAVSVEIDTEVQQNKYRRITNENYE